MSEQTTPRTVEDAAREEAQERYPMTSPIAHLLPGHLTVEARAFVAGATWQAARMPSVEQVAEALHAHNPLWAAGGQAECACGVLLPRRMVPVHQAEQVVALWGAR